MHRIRTIAAAGLIAAVGALAACGADEKPAPATTVADLPACRYEDGSGGPLPCLWEGDKSGNRIGLSLIHFPDRDFRIVTPPEDR